MEEVRQRREELRGQVEVLRTQLERSQERVGLDRDHFRAALSCALELLRAGQLRPLPDGDGGGVARFQTPDLLDRFAADRTWTETLDSLREPRRRDQSVWEWRGQAPLRPVVFEDPRTMTDEVVHLHLEHRLVQRLLGRFTAQGFVHHDLSRACLT